MAGTDAYVMHAWGEQQGANGRVRMLSDGTGALTKALGQEKPSGVLTRSARYSMACQLSRLLACPLPALLCLPSCASRVLWWRPAG